MPVKFYINSAAKQNCEGNFSVMRTTVNIQKQEF